MWRMVAGAEEPVRLLGDKIKPVAKVASVTALIRELNDKEFRTLEKEDGELESAASARRSSELTMNQSARGGRPIGELSRSTIIPLLPHASPSLSRVSPQTGFERTCYKKLD